MIFINGETDTNFNLKSVYINNMDYITIAASSRAEYVEKRSKFIASSLPVSCDSEAVDFISRIKSEFHDARHNTFAYVIRDGAERFSDDGEPQGTAGIPELEILRRRKIVNAVVVVTRYFGGILLGAPGLVRAYGHAAGMVLDDSGIIIMKHCDIVRFSCGYDLYARADGLVRSAGGTVTNRDFGAEVSLEATFPKDKTAAFEKAMTELSAGTVEAEAVGETYCAQN